MTHRAVRAALLAPLLACAALPASCGGSDGDGAAPVTGGAAGKAGSAGKAGRAGAAGAVSAGKAGSAGSVAGATGKCEPGPIPDDLPGWEEYTDYSCDCRFYLPGEKGELPEPVTWEPCTWKYTEGLACQRMRVPWTADGKYGHTIGTAMTWWHDRPTGEVWMAFGRTRFATNPHRWTLLVARVDDEGGGVVETALVKDASFCFGNMLGTQGGRYMVKVTGDVRQELGENYHYGGILTGNGSGRPKVATSWFRDGSETLTPSWAFSRSWVYELFFETRAHPFDDFAHPVPIFTSLNGYKYLASATVGDGLLFAATNAAWQEAGIYWSEPTGLAPLVMYPDGTLSAERVGSDQEDLVWTEVDYASGDQWTYPRRTMTAKWSTDVGVNMATKRDLGVDLPYSSGGFLKAWTVGCGYAAKTFMAQLVKDGPWVGMLRVVRLADGATWSIPGEPLDVPGVKEPTYWLDVYGLTCDEVWVSASSGDSGFFRIRLDSLGPPTPAVK